MVSLPVGQFLVQILVCATVNLQAQEERLDSIGGCCNIPATPGLAIVTSDSYLGS
jgi:hypothetical protein